jgi:hypothetical protein
MLEKLPSWLKKLQLNLSLQRKLNDNTSKISESEGFTYSSEVVLYRRISTFICLVFIPLFFVNAFLNFQLNSLKKDIDARVVRISSYDALEQSYLSVAKSVVTYKKLINTRVSLYDRLSVIYASIPEGITITSLSITPAEFHISLEGDNLLLFSFVLDKFVKSPLIGTLYLESASLKGSSAEGVESYLVSIKGIFK